MKVFAMFALATVLAMTNQVAAQPVSAEVPIWKVNDFWVFRWEEDYQSKNSGTYRRTIVGIDQFEGKSVYKVARGDGSFFLYSADDLANLAQVDGRGGVMFRFSRQGDKTFPLVVGKTYSYVADNPAGKYKGTYSYTVAGIADILVPAGTFQAFRVAEQGKGNYYNGGSFTEQGEIYFVPAVRNWVKYCFSLNSGYKYCNELTQYQVQQE